MSRELQVPAHQLEDWRRVFLKNGSPGLNRAGQSLNRALRNAAAREDEPRDRLLEWIRLYLALLSDPENHEPLALSVRLWAESLDSEVIGEELRRSYREQLTAVRDILREAQGEGRGTRLDPDAGARAVIALLNDAALQVLIDPDMDLDGYGTMVERLVEDMVEPL